jgi:flavin-dependent dehydrogenase
MILTCDALVTGAGPAGLTAATLLSKNGFSVIVIEKNKIPGPLQTSYDITEGAKIRHILQEMRIKPLKISPVSEWFSPNYRFVLDSKIEDYYFKRGPEQDSIEAILLKKLEKKNASVFFETHISALEKRKTDVTEVTIQTPKEKNTIQPKYILSADGTESHLRNKLNIDTTIYATFRGIGAVITTRKQNEIPHARIYFDADLAPGGYVYSGSVKDETFYCLVIDDMFSKKIHVRKNLKKILEKRIQKEMVIKNYFSGIGATGILHNHFKNVLFVGGAALLHDPFLGYGLNYAIESGFTAAQAITQNNIALYEKYLKETQQDIKEMYKIRQIWRNADNTFFDKLLLAFNNRYDRNDIQINQIIDLFQE